VHQTEQDHASEKSNTRCEGGI